MSEEDATERMDPPAIEPASAPIRTPPTALAPVVSPSARPAIVVLGPGAPSAPPTNPSSAPSASGSSSALVSASGARSPVTVAESTVAAMHGEEATRAAAFGRVVAILCVIGLFGQLGYVGNPKLRIAMAVAQSLLGAVAMWVWWRARDHARWSNGVFRVFGLAAALASVVFIHYLGVFSPVTAAIVLGLGFFGLGDDSKMALPLSIAVALQYMVSATLITLGVLPDLGLFVPKDIPRMARFAMAFMVTATMLMQLWQARVSRRATLEAIERSNAAVRLAKTREAQLEEAKENLDAAIRAGAGKEGRYTGALAGRFRLEHVVGRGAMGEVYSARTEDTGDRAAVKLLHIGKLEEPELVSRFLREAEVARRVRGPNLVNVLEVGNAQDGSPFIAMELLSGSDLATLLRDRPNLSLAEVVTLVDDVARGLEVLHAAGVVHRDLKPANLFLSHGPPPKWKILDYGVSKLRESTMTEDQVVGTPGYMSPEQAQGGKVDSRSDIFALGAVAYRTITGRRPFTGIGTPQLLYQVVYAQPVRPREIAASIPRDVELVLAIALAKRPEARFPTSTAFATAMRLASQNALDAKMRAHAERIVRAAPWSKATE
ncbi:MAG: serine/threonine protein kinase [Labilithrix sp.]|nr:serine/threonine protein kinase [Labilithrix sp.]